MPALVVGSDFSHEVSTRTRASHWDGCCCSLSHCPRALWAQGLGWGEVGGWVGGSLMSGLVGYRQSLWLGCGAQWGNGFAPHPPACQACGPGRGHRNTALALFSEPWEAGCHRGGLEAGGKPRRGGRQHRPWLLALPSHRCPCPRVWVEVPLGREQRAGAGGWGLGGGGQMSKESWGKSMS